MSSFAGLSAVTNGRHCTMVSVDVGTDNGYHLLVVKEYSHTIQEISNCDGITCGPFMVGGHYWYIIYHPNGDDPSCADFISLYLCRADINMEEAVGAKFVFSFINQAEYQKPMHIRAAETYSFSSKEVCHGFQKFIKRDALERSSHLKDNCFTIRCDIMVCKDSNTQDVSGTMSDIGQHLGCLLQNKVGADVTFDVSGEMITAHRCVLAARSTVFMAQLFGPMKEGTTSSVIQIKDMEAKLFRALLSFIYTGSFPKMDKNNMEEDKAEVVKEGEEEGAVEYVMWVQDLFVAADMYDIQRLKVLCEEKLSEHIDVTSVASTLVLAEQHHSDMLKEVCLKFIQLQSLPCLKKIMVTKGWEHIRMNYPSLLKEFANVASNQRDKKRKRQMI